MTIASPEKHPRYTSIVGSAGRILGAPWFSNGHRAQLKRYAATQVGPGEAVALRVLAKARAPLEDMRTQEIKNWMRFISCMAILSGPNKDPHSTAKEAKFGTALFRAGYSYERLVQLLDAREDDLMRFLARATLRISRSADAVNWSQVAPLFLAPPNPGSGWADRTRIVIMTDYQLASAHSGTVFDADQSPGRVVSMKASG